MKLNEGNPKLVETDVNDGGIIGDSKIKLPRYLNSKQTAKYLGITVPSLHNLVHAGKIVHFKFGGDKFLPEDIHAYVMSKRVEARSVNDFYRMPRPRRRAKPRRALKSADIQKKKREGSSSDGDSSPVVDQEQNPDGKMAEVIPLKQPIPVTEEIKDSEIISPSSKSHDLHIAWLELLEGKSWIIICTFTLRHDSLPPEVVKKKCRTFIGKTNDKIFGPKWKKHTKGIRWAMAIEKQRLGGPDIHIVLGGRGAENIKIDDLYSIAELIRFGSTVIEEIQNMEMAVEYVCKGIPNGIEIDHGGDWDRANDCFPQNGLIGSAIGRSNPENVSL
ncbi:MAG: helix-turn-helix domain-containing protein [Candidatus Pacebacteria bacterium]|nr:helix-turn-helix domain-containing protein [Candidatus Paceibacterota bacterium]MDD5222474.1 helix-turn-helix domain-containing protein [bacterium]